MKTAQQSSLKKKIAIVMSAGVLVAGTLVLSSPLTKSIFAQDVTKKTTDSNPLAQNRVSLTAIPPRLGEDNSLKALPGEKLQVQLRVKNLSEEAVDVVTTTKDFIIDKDGETPIAIDGSVSNRWSLASWLTITPAENTIAPKQTIGLNVLIEIPKDALPGGHYAMILHQPNKAANGLEIQGESSSSVNQRVGTLLYVVVDGPINEEAYVRNFTFPDFTEYGPVPFSFTVENNSDIHITPQTHVEIFNVLNQKVDDVQVDAKNVFPLTSRDFKGEWKRIWGFGLYTAKLTTSFGTSGSVIMAKTSFWLLPVKILIAIITGLLTIIVLTLSIKRHLNYRKDLDQKRIADLENQIQEMNSNETDMGDRDDPQQL